MKALIISGGGSKGAFAGGVAEYLIKDCCHNYDLFAGCSTGSLLLPHLALGEIEKIKELYTSVTQDDIFSISPFTIKKTKKGYETKINHFNTIKTFMSGSSTFGESYNLRKLIATNLTEKEYEELRHRNKKLIVAVSNLTMNKVEYFNSFDCNYEDFCNWTWASCNYIPFMSIYDKNNCQYADGGFGSFIPILSAIENGAKEIDVIILENEEDSLPQKVVKNPFALLFRTFQFMMDRNSSKDVIIGKLLAVNKKVKINFYYTPIQLTDNPLIFDSQQMKQWWKDGYEFAKSQNPISYCHVPNV